jgi:energy-coupling factor transport system ATP-binding protein
MPEKQFIRNSVRDEMAHGLNALGLPAEEIEKRVEAVLEEVQLTDRGQASPYVLSHGQKRRLSVACMVVTEPEVVVLDEPTFGQDWRQAQKLMEFMRALADRGAAVVFITHDMRLVAEYADRCVAMCEGRIIFDGEPSALFDDRAVLSRARLKPPPVYRFSRRIAGAPALSSTRLIELLEETHGRPRTFL